MVLWREGAYLQFPHGGQSLESRGAVLQSLVGISIGIIGWLSRGGPCWSSLGLLGFRT